MPIIETRSIDDVDLTQDQSRDWKEEYLPACDGDPEMADECFRLSHVNDGQQWIPLEQYKSVEANKEIMGDSESDDLDFGDLKESDLQEAWSDSARKAAAESRRRGVGGKHQVSGAEFAKAQIPPSARPQSERQRALAEPLPKGFHEKNVANELIAKLENVRNSSSYYHAWVNTLVKKHGLNVYQARKHFRDWEPSGHPFSG